MNFLVRALRYIKYKKAQVLLQILIFTVIFSFVVSGIVIYSTSDHYVDTLKKSVKNCVTISAINLTYNWGGAVHGTYIPIEYERVEKLIDHENVNSHNYSYFQWVSFENKYKTIQKDTDIPVMGVQKDATIYTTVNSEWDSAFTTLGYSLAEGRHIKENEADINVCIVSKQFMELNNLKLGDEISAVIARTKEPQYNLKVVGVFNTPVGEYRRGYGDSPDELIIIPSKNNTGMKHSIFSLSVYIDEEENISEYIKYLETNFNIRKVSDTRYDYSAPPVPKEAENLDFEESILYYEENEYMDVYTDSEWYDMVAKPTEKVRDLSGYLAIGFAIGALMIMLLFCSIAVRKRQREFGILISMGESKIRMVAQICFEVLITVIISSVLGLFAGVFVSAPLVQSYTDSAYSAQAEIDTKENASQEANYIEATDITDLGFNHVALPDLLYKSAGRTTVAPNIKPYYSHKMLFIYVAIVIIAILLSVLLQMLYITRVKPIKLLGKRR